MAAAQQFTLFHFDAAYLTALQQRDAATEAHFVSYFGGLLQRKLRNRLRWFDEIKDIQQETIFRVLAAVYSGKGVRRPECFGAFVNAVCDNILRERGRFRRWHQPLDDTIANRQGDSEGPETTIAAQEVKATVDETLARLLPRDRNLLRGVYLQEKDKATICEEMEITRNYLRVLLFRAKQEFLAHHKRISQTGPRRRRGRTAKAE